MSSLLRKVLLMGSGGGAASLGLKTNLVAWWELDEASGNRADSHTNALTLTDNNTVTSNPGIGGSGTAAQFTAANTEYLSRASGANLQTGDIDFTFCAWVYLDSKPTAATVIAKYEGTTPVIEYLIDYLAASDRFRLIVSSDGTAGAGRTILTATASGAASLSTWYFIAAGHDATNNQIFFGVNGGALETAAHAGGVFVAANAFRLGSLSSGANYFDGRMAKVGFWKSAAGAGGKLSTAQITSLYNVGAGVTYAQL